MSAELNIIGHIGFRSGSKGLPRKNFKKFNGKPLFQWSLDQLLSCNYLSGICISTDDEDAYELSKKHGCIDIGIRSAELSNSSASKFSVWQDSAKKISELSISYDAMLDLDCTAPLRSMEDIENGLNVFKTHQPDIAMSITDARKNPYFNIMEEDSEGYLKISKGNGKVFSRQSAPLVYEHASSTYIISRNFLENGQFLYDAKIKGFYMPFERALDIDSELDWEIANLFYRKFNAV